MSSSCFVFAGKCGGGVSVPGGLTGPLGRSIGKPMFLFFHRQEGSASKTERILNCVNATYARIYGIKVKDQLMLFNWVDNSLSTSVHSFVHLTSVAENLRILKRRIWGREKERADVEDQKKVVSVSAQTVDCREGRRVSS